MSPLVPLVMYGWIPVVLYLFVRFPPQRAVIVSFIAAWLFLPMASFTMSPFPPYTKMAATCYGIMLATIIYDLERLVAFKPGLLDLPMLIWCLCPIASQVSNGLSPISPPFNQLVTWGIPYFLGRIYFNNLDGMRQLALGIFTGGLAYIPFTMFEGVAGPLLHLKIYGFNAFEDWSQARRLGGWRPVVFMQHGLMVGMWMMTATLIGIWLWRTGVIKKHWNRPINQLVIVLLIAFLLCRSTGAYNLLVFGLGILFIGKQFRTAFPLYFLVGFVVFYLYMAASGNFSGGDTVSFINQVFGEERAGSLKFRFDNEEILGARARQMLLFGWGDAGGNRVRDAWGRDISVTDSLWIITFGVNGLVGLISLFSSLLLPAVSFCLRYPSSTWSNRKVAPAAVLAVTLVLYVLDCVLNAMVNPVFALISGAVAGLAMADPETKKVKKRRFPAPQRQHQSS